MGLKKTFLVAGAALAGMLTGSTLTNNAPTANRGVSINEGGGKTTAKNNTQQSPVQKTQAAQQMAVKSLPKSRITPHYRSRGTSPKEWGQYLQSRGKQKWSKAA